MKRALGFALLVVSLTACQVTRTYVVEGAPVTVAPTRAAPAGMYRLRLGVHAVDIQLRSYRDRMYVGLRVTAGQDLKLLPENFGLALDGPESPALFISERPADLNQYSTLPRAQPAVQTVSVGKGETKEVVTAFHLPSPNGPMETTLRLHIGGETKTVHVRATR